MTADDSSVGRHRVVFALDILDPARRASAAVRRIFIVRIRHRAVGFVAVAKQRVERPIQHGALQNVALIQEGSVAGVVARLLADLLRTGVIQTVKVKFKKVFLEYYLC